MTRLMPFAAAVSMLVLFTTATAQPSQRPDVVAGNGIQITDGLVLPGWDYFQSAWQVDPLELGLVQGTWSRPAEAEAVDSERVWQSARADSSGWISHPDLRGGYLYSSVESTSQRIMILEGHGYRQVTVNGVPRTGNVYGFKEEWQPWEPPFDYSFVPIKLQAGGNHLLFKGGRAPRMKAVLHDPGSPYVLNTRDVTIPDLLLGEDVDYSAAVALINATEMAARGLVLDVTLGDAPSVQTELPVLPPLSVRKVGFRIEGPAPDQRGKVPLRLVILHPSAEQTLDVSTIHLDVKHPHQNHRRTFLSSIDGSVQYYGLNPAQDRRGSDRAALVLSVHGAAVEAINQSGSYRAKPWAHIVAPTNRRPYGFNWEDWGRMDALEVLGIAQSTLGTDPGRVYLTGHSMGGHGTWHLGALYPDRFGAIGPSAGWISFWSYRPRREMGLSSPLLRMLMRAALPSRTMALAPNYRDIGVYVIHGTDDNNVPAEQSRMMVDLLSGFHRGFVYHEESEAGHWWDKSDEEGADCVDWPPLFDFFARHFIPRPHEVRKVDFLTPNPGVSSCYHWACILQQERHLEMSRVSLRFDPAMRRFVGETTNVERLTLAVPETGTDSITVSIDGQTLRSMSTSDRLHLALNGEVWTLAGDLPVSHKGPHRNGTLKDVFRNHMVFVYGTGGSVEENEWALSKARFDAEQFWYQGNGSVDLVPDSVFVPGSFGDRNVILYGNADTNTAWDGLFGASPVQVSAGLLEVGERSLTGDSLGVLVIRPRPDSDVASMAAIGGTGIAGMRITNLRPYLSAGFAYPDLVIFDAGERAEDLDIVVSAGFFGNDWSIENGEFVWVDE